MSHESVTPPPWLVGRLVWAAARCRSAVVALAATSLLLAACGSGGSTGSSGEPEEPTSPATASTLTASTPTATSDLEGTWQAGPISLEDTADTIRRHGLGRYVKDYRANAPFSGDTVLVLTIENGAWDLYGKSGGGQPEPIDYDADYEIDGDTVTFHHSDGSTTYNWEVDGDTLRLEYAESTMPRYDGIPDEVYQRALYMTAPFTRQS
jgi:hypothetical protein